MTLSALTLCGVPGLKIFKMATKAAIFNTGTEHFSNSESLFCSDASQQVSAPFELQFGRRYLLKIFKMADMAAILDIRTVCFKQF